MIGVCDECGRPVGDEWGEEEPGPDYGSSHKFCAECLDLIEMGQGLDDPVERDEWAEVVRESEEAKADIKRARRLMQQINMPRQ